MTVLRYDAGVWPEKAEITPEGFLRADAPITRMGVLQYKNPDGSPRGELRHPDDWTTPATLSSFASIPLTNGHPPARADGQPLVDATNAKELAIGWTGESVRVEGAFLRAPMTIIDAEGVSAVKRGRRGTSTGVVVDLREESGTYDGVAYQYRQLSPRGNHVAIVDNPRAGTMIRLDGNQAAEDAAEGVNMVKVMLDGISYDAAPEVANALGKSQGEIKALATRLDEAATAARAAADKIAAERDTFKERLDAVEKRDIRSEVRARVTLEGSARQVLPKEQHAKIGEMSDDDIRRAVVVATWPELKLDDKSKDYIATRFDIALEDQSRKAADDRQHADALGEQRRQTAPRADSGGDELADAAQRAAERIANQWKGKAA